MFADSQLPMIIVSIVAIVAGSQIVKGFANGIWGAIAKTAGRLPKEASVILVYITAMLYTTAYAAVMDKPPVAIEGVNLEMALTAFAGLVYHLFNSRAKKNADSSKPVANAGGTPPPANSVGVGDSVTTEVTRAGENE